MITKSPPEVLTPEDQAYISTLNECERRQFLATKAVSFHKQGFSISKITKIMKSSKNTIYKGIRELRTASNPPKGRVRHKVGGRKALLSQHPEWIDALKVIIKPHTAGLPIISIDTKKKELIGNFKRNGKVLSKGQPKSLDHDFASFSDAQIIPHGIYDITKNVGYQTIGTSHDTSKFVCDNIYNVWKEHLQEQYHDVHTLVIMCDGGGSNASSHRIVKQDLMILADKLNMNLLVMHYPPYCSMFNPIEHRMFPHISHNWSGAPLLSVKEAAKRAAGTTTSMGLTVNVDINSKTYEIQRPIDKAYEKMVEKRIVFHSNLPKWNYLIKPA